MLIQFNVNGVSKVGADGLAWWLVREVNVMGKFFGFREEFHGIGVVVDTYDNDGSGTPLFLFVILFGRKSSFFFFCSQTGKHPSISLCTNDGSKDLLPCRYLPH